MVLSYVNNHPAMGALLHKLVCHACSGERVWVARRIARHALLGTPPVPTAPHHSRAHPNGPGAHIHVACGRLHWGPVLGPCACMQSYVCSNSPLLLACLDVVHASSFSVDQDALCPPLIGLQQGCITLVDCWGASGLHLHWAGQHVTTTYSSSPCYSTVRSVGVHAHGVLCCEAQGPAHCLCCLMHCQGYPR